MDRPAIAVQGLVKKFGSVEALAGIDFEVAPGTIFGLLGPNGAGKTTAVRILATILKPDAGRAEVLGYDVVRSANAVRHVIGLAGQYAAVDPNLTGRENLRLVGTLAQLPRTVTKERAQELLERFDLVAAGDRPIKTYSGGMRRRLDVAAALMSRPPVLFLDEPTSGLDIQSRTELWVVIKELVAEGSTVLLTTQYLEEADQLADRIAVINEGRVVANDTAAALKSELGSSVIEVTLASEGEADRAYAVMSRLTSTPLERLGTKVRLTTPDAPTVLTQVLRALDSTGLHAAGISVHEPSLDDVFLSLTGKNKSSAPAQPAAAPVPRAETAAHPIVKAADAVSYLIDELEDPRAGGSGHQLDEPLVFEGRRSTDNALQSVLASLPYRAGSGAVVDNLREVAEAAYEHYRSGGGDHIELAPLSGYLTLEQRFGRISASVAPEQAAALLMGAALASGSGLTTGGRSSGQDNFAEGAVRILFEGIAETGSAKARR